MRVAILVLAIIGSLVAFGGAACATVCAAGTASLDAGLGDLEKSMKEEMKKQGASQKEIDEIDFGGTDATGSLALTAGAYGIMGLLGLVGGIMGFSKLGKGEPATLGGGLLAGGLGLGIILSVVGGGVGAIVGTIIMGGEFLGIACILAFVAKPAQPVQQPQQPMADPGQQPPQA